MKASALARKNKHLLVVNNKDALIKSIGRDADADADAESIYSIEITCNERWEPIATKKKLDCPSMLNIICFLIPALIAVDIIENSLLL